MLAIIHLSDLHIHKDDRKSDNKNAKLLVKHLIERFAGYAKTKTCVVATGDLTDDATLVQYKKLQTHVLQPLAQQFTLLAVPGNHDYARWGTFFDRQAPARYERYVLPHLQINQGSANRKYPCITARPGEAVVFFGLDSADPLDQVWFAEGCIREDQRQALDALLADPKYKDYFKVVYLHHHPFVRWVGMKLDGAEDLLKILSRRADLVLFGHKHKPEAFFRWYHVPLMLASGKVTEAVGGNTLAYRVLEVDQGQIVRVTTEEIASAAP